MGKSPSLKSRLVIKKNHNAEILSEDSKTSSNPTCQKTPKRGHILSLRVCDRLETFEGSAQAGDQCNHKG